MFAPSMEHVAARLLCERVPQELAGLRVARNHLPLSRFIVTARLIIIPFRGARRKTLQPERSPRRMANVAACVARTPGQKYGLYASFEKFKVQSGHA